MNTQELGEENGERCFQLEFEKVSGAPKPDPIPYHVEDMSGEDDEKAHLRRIVWG